MIRYQDELITVIEGNSEEVLPSLGTFDLLLTDPPYGMGDVLTRAASGSRWKKHFESGPLPWDVAAPVSFVQSLPRMSKHSIIWGGQFFALPPSRGWLIWNKIIRNWSSSECELAWTSLEQPNRAFDYSHGQLAHENKIHPTQKPLALMRWCIKQAPEGIASILDPFGGSLTTAIAARREGIKCTIIEREPKYIEAGIKRLKNEPTAMLF